MQLIHVLIFLITYLFSISSYGLSYEDIISKYFSNRKLDTIEGIWGQSFIHKTSTGKYIRRNINYDLTGVEEAMGEYIKGTDNYYYGENWVYYGENLGTII